jgi:intracellular septation protein
MQKLIIDLFPVVLFFVAYKISDDMFVATAVAIVSAIAQIGLMKWKKIAIQPIHWISLVMIVVLGTVSILFREPMFLKWKFSVLEWSMGAAILIGQYVFGKNMLKLLMGNELQLADDVWKKLGLMWALFFIFLGTLNIYIAYQYDDATWVNFKTYGALGLSMVFVLAQSIWLSKHLPAEVAKAEHE